MQGEKKRWMVGIVFTVLGLAMVAAFWKRPFAPSPPAPSSSPDALLKTLPLNQIQQRQLFAEGDELFRKGHYRQARIAYQKVLIAIEAKRREFLRRTEKTLRKVTEDEWDEERIRQHLGELAAWTRWRIAYSFARQKRWDEAIAAFRELLTHYDGTWQFRPTQPYALPERALFQIACCYRGKMREAKDPKERERLRQKAINAFCEVMVQFPDSPISVLAARAITDLNGGKLPERAGRLYYQVLKRDEEERRRQEQLFALCGPAALYWLLKTHFPNLLLPSIDGIAQRTKTDETGTSLFALKQVAKQLGVRTSALEVTFDGLKEIPLPALLLFHSHYVVVTKVSDQEITIVNPIPPAMVREGKRVREGRWQFQESFLSKEQLGREFRGAVLVVLGRD